MNQTLNALMKQATPQIVNAIKGASRNTGVDFAYLMEQAAAESSFNPSAKAKTSSASGLFQFIETTWMRMVKNHGDKYGLENFAKHIDDAGNVSDPAMRQKILDLRNDPETASQMAAEFASENKAYLTSRLQKSDKDLSSTDLYLAHFLGAGGATAFLSAMEENPLQYGVDIMPKAAKANQNVFYDPATGQPRTLAGIYEFFDKKFSAGHADYTEQDTGGNASKTPLRIDSGHFLNQRKTGNYEADLAVSGSYRDMVQDMLGDVLNLQGQMKSAVMGKIQSDLGNRFGYGVVQSPVELMLMAQLSPSYKNDPSESSRYK